MSRYAMYRNLCARGGLGDGSPVPDEDDYRRLCRAQMALVTAMASTDDPDFVEEAADCYSRLDSLILDGDKWNVRMHDDTTALRGWLRSEHVGEMDEALAEARRLATPNGRCPECGGDCPTGLECLARRVDDLDADDEDYSICELTDGECDSIRFEGPLDDTFGGSGNRTRGD